MRRITCTSEHRPELGSIKAYVEMLAWYYKWATVSVLLQLVLRLPTEVCFHALHWPVPKHTRTDVCTQVFTLFVFIQRGAVFKSRARPVVYLPSVFEFYGALVLPRTLIVYVLRLSVPT